MKKLLLFPGTKSSVPCFVFASEESLQGGGEGVTEPQMFVEAVAMLDRNYAKQVL